MTNYKEHEIEVIVEEVQKYPNNLKHAFEEASYRLPKRTAGAISGFYYGHLKKSRRIMTAMATPSGVITNTKNSPRIRSGKVRMLQILMSTLTREEKEEATLMFFNEL